MQRIPTFARWGLPAVICAAMAMWAAVPDQPLRLMTQVYPPYQYQSNGEIVGTSVATMACALKATGHPYTLEIVRGQGWAEAQAMVKRGERDGFFGALHTQGRDEYAVWSSALDLNKTYFFKLKTNPISRKDVKARFAVKKGSGIQAQIEGTTINVSRITDDNPQSVAALLEGSADFVYMDLNIFKWSVAENGLPDESLFQIVGTPDVVITTDHFELEPVADQLYGAYFSRDWLRKHPGFMERFNGAVGDCRTRRELSWGFHFPRLALARRRETLGG